MDEIRANPDEILHRIKKESHTESRGHLKIFFGYAAGVGKTYAMLKAAHAAKRRGLDIAVGYVEPHTRPQTLALLDGLEQLPALTVSHKGISLHEFDLDGAIKRAPQLILVDELAHTNAEGCRHSKRYQDVEELLRAGIDVYTTVNVQHIESLNDMVASITGVTVRERVPDHLFDDADQVELVDIEPEELIDRLHAGQIYQEAQANRALEHFFSIENLTALREIALRRCADRINKMSEKVKSARGSGYFTDEHILICVSSSPTNAKIIRTAARMADAFKGSLTALFVETPEFASMSEANKQQLRSNIHLAQQMGATIETVYGDDIAFQIAEFARLSGVSKIVMGRASARRKFFGKPSLTERLTNAAPNLDIYIIPDKATTAYRRPKRAQAKPLHFSWADLLKTLLILAACTAIGYLFELLGFSEANIIMIYILGVLITAVATTGRVYSLASSLASVLVFNFFFTVPRFTFNAYDSGYPVTFFIMFVAAFLSSSLATKIKRHARQSAETAFRTKILFDTNQLMQKGNGKEEIVSITANQLVKLLKKDIIFYLAENGKLLPPVLFPANASAEPEDYNLPNEQAVAAWVQKNNKRAGATTDTLGSAKCLYLAVRVSDMVYGVVGIGLAGEAPLDSFENSIVLSILGECALALENERAIREREESAVLAKNEQLRANLLRSISHDLRTPLTSISGNAGVLMANGEGLGTKKCKQLYTAIYDDSLWLINLVENLLSVTRIEDGTMQLKLTAELVDEAVAEAVRHISRQSAEHHIIIRQQEDFLLAKMDARLIVQVIINIVDNAVKYTPKGSTITITTRKEGKWAAVEIADDGPGIPDDAKPRIFDMFYTAGAHSADSRRSLGLGLALCKSIINAHGGEISVADNQPSGTIFRFTLPAEEVTLHA